MSVIILHTFHASLVVQRPFCAGRIFRSPVRPPQKGKLYPYWERLNGGQMCLRSGIMSDKKRLALDLLHFWVLGVHVGVVEGVSGAVAVQWVCGVWAREAAGFLLETVAVREQAQVQQLRRWVRLFTRAIIVQVINVHKPLGPKFPPDALAVHG